jgi:hypothetical protein
MQQLDKGLTEPEGSYHRDHRVPRPAKVRATFQVPAELLDELRNAVVALSGPPHRLTLARVVENALRSELVRLRELQGGGRRGKTFPQRDAEVRTGRPIGS